MSSIDVRKYTILETAIFEYQFIIANYFNDGKTDYCPGDVHWARLEALALGSLIAACPAWKRREERRQIILKIRRFIEIRCLFMLLDDN